MFSCTSDAESKECLSIGLSQLWIQICLLQADFVRYSYYSVSLLVVRQRFCSAAGLVTGKLAFRNYLFMELRCPSG